MRGGGGVLRLRVFSTAQKYRAFNYTFGLMLGKWHRWRPNIELALHQHVG